MFVLHPLRVLAFKADLSQQNLPEIHDAAFRHCRKIEGFACSPRIIEYRKTKGSNTRCQSDKYGNSYKCFYSDHPTSFLWQTRTNTYIIAHSIGYLANTHLSSLTKKTSRLLVTYECVGKTGCYTCADRRGNAWEEIICSSSSSVLCWFARSFIVAKFTSWKPPVLAIKLNDCHMECIHMSL